MRGPRLFIILTLVLLSLTDQQIVFLRPSGMSVLAPTLQSLLPAAINKERTNYEILGEWRNGKRKTAFGLYGAAAAAAAAR